MTPTPKLSLPTDPRRRIRFQILLVLLALAPLGPGCDVPEEPEEPAAGEPRAAPTRPPLTPEQESALTHLAALAMRPLEPAEIPTGLTAGTPQQEQIAEQSRKYGAVAKITYDFKAEDGSSKLVYTIYPTLADAEARFGTIGEVPPERKGVKSRDPLAIAGIDVPTWGEVSVEEYGGSTLVRTSAAARIGRVLTVTQTITMTSEPTPQALTRTIDLLKLAVAHAQAVPDPAAAASAAPAAATKAEASATPTLR